MKKRAKRFPLLCAVLGMLVCCVGCGKKDDKGSVYYLNFKPESGTIWEDIAKQYTEETGVEVKVVTAATAAVPNSLFLVQHPLIKLGILEICAIFFPGLIPHRTVNLEKGGRLLLGNLGF